MVATTVARALVFGNLRNLLIPYTLVSRTEVVECKGLHIALDKALCSHDAGTTATPRSEGIHRKRCGDVALELHDCHIVVALVVVATEYAAAIVCSFEFLTDKSRIASWKVEYMQMSFSALVDVNCRVWTLCLVWTAVGTTLWCALRHILRTEEVQRTLRSDSLAWLTNQPTQNIEVVARLCQDDRGSLGR